MLAVRIDTSVPIFANFKNWLAQARGQVSAQSAPSGATLKRIAKHRGVLILFLTNGTIKMDHNTVERTIRPIAISRQYRILAGDQAAVQNWVIQASLIEPCQVNGIEPHGYMTWRITAFANGHRLTQISELLKSDRNLTVCSELRFRSACCQGSFYH
jgi:transposase